MADNELQQIINKMIADNKESWKKEFLSIYPTYEKRVAALKAMLQEYNDNWKRQFESGNFVKNEFPPAWLNSESKSNLDKFNKEWPSMMKDAAKVKTTQVSDFDVRGIVNKKLPTFDVEAWKKELKDAAKLGTHPTDNWNQKFKKDLTTDKWNNPSKYLPGKDFRFTDYANTPSEELVKQIKKNWLLDTFTGKNQWNKEFGKGLTDYYKNLNRSEQAAWKNDIKDAIEMTKRRGLGAIDDLLGQLDPRKYFENFKENIGKAISDSVMDIRNQSINLITNQVNDVIDNFQDTASRWINGRKTELFNAGAKIGQSIINKARESYGPMADKLSSIIPSGAKGMLSPLTNMFSQNLSNIASALNLGNIFGGFAAGSLQDMPMGSSARDKRIVNRDYRLPMYKTYTPEMDKDWDLKNPLMMGDSLRSVIKVMAEDNGFVLDRQKSVILSRESLFINRPYLESETSGYYRSFVFFTRPNCNLFNNSRIIPELQAHPDFFARVSSDPNLYMELCRDGALKSNCWRLLSNYCVEVPTIRLSESTREGIKNMHGKSTPLPGNPEIYDQVDISITFMDNNRGDISKLLYTLSMYKDLVGKQEWPMRKEYIKFRGLDYLISMWVVVVNVDWDVISLGVAKNLIINEPVTHFNQHKIDGFNKNDLLENFTASFKATSYRPDAPEFYEVFNKLFGFNPQNIVDVQGSNGITLMGANRHAQNKAFDESKMVRDELLRNDYSPMGGFPLKGTSEMIALNPGFYRLPPLENIVIGNRKFSDRRPRIKFGFSW